MKDVKNGKEKKVKADDTKPAVTTDLKSETTPKEVKTEEKAPVPKMRQIIIETDGSNISLAKAEVLSRIELIAILENMLRHLNQAK